ncbi:MAG TPA: COX15/CtaA family protein [Candidatus Saccharimonadales bacterium]|nr:COX15/CtaA family protein [Candidatus Saccharimonadales bacterium]
MTARSTNNIWLHRFAMATALATLFLIWMGGLVTSHGVGMSVPDWPTTYGYNMYLFPVSKWTGGIFYEHTHRLVASWIGYMTAVLCGWLLIKEKRRWLRWLGVAALFLVAVQAVLGGLRVTLYKDELGIFHASLAQMFFVLVSSIALFTSRWWVSEETAIPVTIQQFRVRNYYAGATLLILLQLALGSTMRHQHAGLAIPDFPTAYGQLWPNMSAAAIEQYNQTRVETVAANPITALQILLQMIHRILALIIFVLVITAWWKTRRELGVSLRLTKIATIWVGLLCLQILLGAATIWSHKSPYMTTLHVAVGALNLMTGAMLFLVANRCLKRETVNESVPGLREESGEIRGMRMPA